MSEEAVLWVFAGFATVFGLIIGSFWNVCIVRWPQDRSVVLPRSHCPACGAQLSILDNIPLISWIALRGRCRSCDASIPATYPLVELLGGLLGFLVYRRIFGSVSDFDAVHLLAFLTYFTFVSALVIASVADLRHRIIPDETSVYAIPLGILAVLFLDALGYDGWLAMPWQQSVIGTLVTGSGLATVAIAWVYLFGYVGLGHGDIKLMAMVGAFLGLFPGALFVLLFGSILGSVVGIGHLLATGRRAHLPFGPPLALTAIVWVLYGDTLGRILVPHWIQG